MIGKCKRCGATIRFVKTRLGKMMPCDAHPVAIREDLESKDTFVTASGFVIHARRLEGTEAEHAPLFGYVTHFATCPAANEMRRRKR